MDPRIQTGRLTTGRWLQKEKVKESVTERQEMKGSSLRYSLPMERKATLFSVKSKKSKQPESKFRAQKEEQ